MSDSVKHECGIALLRLRKPLEYYRRKYGTSAYGFARISLLLEKQHNRGQDGAGLACVSLDAPPGRPFYSLEKSCSSMPLADLLERVSGILSSSDDLQGAPFCGEVFLGHVRYGTFGTRNLDACHPMVDDNPRRDHTLLAAGNFNLTNTREIFNSLVALGYHPRSYQDCGILLTALSHHITECCGSLAQAIGRAAQQWDGGFVVAGVLGNGNAFALRDSAGIRPAFYYVDDEVVALASERVALQTTFNLNSASVKELPPGHALLIDYDGSVDVKRLLETPFDDARALAQKVFDAGIGVFRRDDDPDGASLLQFDGRSPRRVRRTLTAGEEQQRTRECEQQFFHL